MKCKIVTLLFVFLIIHTQAAFVKRDVNTVPSNQKPNVLESFQLNLEEFRKCLDQSLAKSLSDVNEKQLQPVFAVVGDSLNRVSKAFDDLTAPSSKLRHNEN